LNEFQDAEDKFNTAREKFYLLKLLFPARPGQQAPLFNQTFLKSDVESDDENQYIPIGAPEGISGSKGDKFVPIGQPPEEISSSTSQRHIEWHLFWPSSKSS
jgi:hypothetical protein